MSIALNWSRKDPRFKLLHEVKQGVVYASNLGSRLAEGEYIARMDADDIAVKNRLEAQVKFLDTSRNFDAVAGKARFIAGNNPSDGFKKYVDWSNSLISFENIKLKRFIESPIINPTAMWRKSSEVKFGSYQNGGFPEDYELWLRWLSKGAQIAKIDDFVLDWHDSSLRLTRTGEQYSNQAFYKIKTKYLAEWLERNNPFHPKVLIWGASRLSRKRAQMLEKFNIEIEAYIDITNKRQVSDRIIHYSQIPQHGKHFILTYINHLNVRAKVNDYLESKGYIEGLGFLNVS